MNIEYLIWSEVKVSSKNEPDVVHQNVTVRYTQNGVISIWQYSSSQGVNTGNILGFAFPEIVDLSPTQMILTAWSWSDTKLKDKKHTLTFTF